MSTPETPAPAPKKSKRLILVVALVVLVLGGGGGAAYVVMARSGAKAAEPAPPPPKPTGIIALEPFVVNLADANAQRFLRITPSLVVDDLHAKEVTESDLLRMRIRSAILELLAQQTSEALVTPEGKAALKKAIAERAGQAADGLHVSDVLLSEFVVQF